uniref:sodium-dependent proline transporter n=1 Tax=Ciona intestinalis TaxID=7719 RepID=UPI000180B18A|nr:sodium-dependent proline transporter [Ciona intestinalis]|eukprot:XP_002127953.1 sodium-dependent proline transporter [Ciona intestinalis]
MADTKSDSKAAIDRQVEGDREKRGMWGSQVEFLLSCIGYCVGLGNVWRFPYLAYQSGGGAFLIPYIIMLTFCGIPLFLIELGFGQFSGYGAITAWRASPMFKGIGFGMLLVSFFVIIYYNVIIAYAFYYMFASFTSVLPWTLCDQWWNKEAQCGTPTTMLNCTNNCTMNATMSPVNVTMKVTAIKRVSPSEEYWKYRVLRIDRSSGIGDPGPVLWDLCLCLLLSWLVVFFCLMKGVKSSGKVVYFTATFPYLILFILLIRGVTLDGAGEGIKFYVTPQWERLKDSKVWSQAATQIFYSLGISFGGLLTFASYNRFSQNIYRDTLIVALGNCGTSIFAGFVIFSVIGHMAFKLNLNVDQVVDQGPGLAFIAYPEAVALLPAPQLWSILFFFMLITLGLDSQFAMAETVITGLSDEFPHYLRDHKSKLTALICGICFLLGLLLVTEGGFHWFNLYNWYSAYYGLYFLTIFLCLAVTYGYGHFFTHPWRFNKDMKLMLGHEPNWYYRINWMLISPALLFFISIFSIVNYSPISLNNVVYPKWADNLGMCMSLTVAAVVPLYMIYRASYAWYKGEDIAKLFKPEAKWGPQDRSIAYDPVHGAVPIGGLNAKQGYGQDVDDKIPDPFPISL